MALMPGRATNHQRHLFGIYFICGPYRPIFRAVTRRFLIAGTWLLLLAGCGDDAVPPEHAPAALDRTPPSHLVRLDRSGGDALVYDLPALSVADWEARNRLPAIATVIGSSTTPAQVVLRDTEGNVVALGLDSRRGRTLDQDVALGAIGADGSLYTVDTAGRAFEAGRRTPQRYAHTFAGVPDYLSAGAEGRLIGVDTSAPALEVLRPSDTLRIVPIASGRVALTSWGDLAAVATDTALLLYQPSSDDPPQSVDVGGAIDVEFSPSGHRVYVLAREGELVTVDRFSRRVRGRINLPGEGVALRAGNFGRWLLVAAAGGNSAWVVDLDADSLVGELPTIWDEQFPLLTSPNLVITADGDDVVARSLTGAGFPETGRVTDAAGDAWVSVAWGPEDAPSGSAETAEAAAADSAGTPADSAAGEQVFLQVSSSQNPEWAQALADKLGAAGLDASVLQPSGENTGYRVVLGPFASREEAETAGRSLGMPYFVIDAPTAAP